MAYSSVNIAVPPGDKTTDWVLVATNPVFLKVRIRDGVKWQLAVTAAGAPNDATGFTTHLPNNDQGSSGWEFQQLYPAATAALFYVRVPQQKALQGDVEFGVIRDQ